MRSVAFFAVLTLGTGVSLGAAAQAPASAPALLFAQPSGQNCPVSLSARRVPGGGLSEVNTAPATHGQALHLTFAATDARAVVQADVVLHGKAGHRVILAEESLGGHTTENFTVSPSAGANHSFNSVLYLKKLTAVDYVELKELTFADGSTWHASASSTCRVTPDNFRLVAGGR